MSETSSVAQIGFTRAAPEPAIELSVVVPMRNEAENPDELFARRRPVAERAAAPTRLFARVGFRQAAMAYQLTPRSEQACPRAPRSRPSRGYSRRGAVPVR